ncbi:MAG: YraN family protein [Gemmatimonadetes bacterium]|nr:YraN family protein [Gemmatimonadota bacterium]
MAPSHPHPPHALGRFGETRAREYLVERGWTIEAANYRFGRREVDLVARRGNLVAFVEVKTRAGAGYGSPEEAVTRLKRREIELVALEYLVRHRLDDVDVRFDVLAVTVENGVRVEHFEDAWRPEARR